MINKENSLLINIKEQSSSEYNRLYIYRILKENILLLNLKPGEKISEVKLKNIFNVSRSPIREAIVRLNEEALIDVLPQRGTYISLLDYNIIEQSIFMRYALDKEIMRLACSKENNKKVLITKLGSILKKQENIAKKTSNMSSHDVIKFRELNEAFHREIYNYFNKANLWEITLKFSTHLYRFHTLESMTKSNIDFALNQHVKIIDSISKNKYDDALSLEENILSNFRKTFKIMFDKYPKFFKKINF